VASLKSNSLLEPKAGFRGVERDEARTRPSLALCLKFSEVLSKTMLTRRASQASAQILSCLTTESSVKIYARHLSLVTVASSN